MAYRIWEIWGPTGQDCVHLFVLLYACVSEGGGVAFFSRCEGWCAHQSRWKQAHSCLPLWEQRKRPRKASAFVLQHKRSLLMLCFKVAMCKIEPSPTQSESDSVFKNLNDCVLFTLTGVATVWWTCQLCITGSLIITALKIVQNCLSISWQTAILFYCYWHIKNIWK